MAVVTWSTASVYGHNGLRKDDWQQQLTSWWTRQMNVATWAKKATQKAWVKNKVECLQHAEVGSLQDEQEKTFKIAIGLDKLNCRNQAKGLFHGKRSRTSPSYTIEILSHGKCIYQQVKNVFWTSKIWNRYPVGHTGRSLNCPDTERGDNAGFDKMQTATRWKSWTGEFPVYPNVTNGIEIRVGIKGLLYCDKTQKWKKDWINHIPSLHCTVFGFALDWESHKSLKHDRECLTELLERAFFQPYPIQRIQLAEVGWESDDKGFERKRGWMVCIKSCATFSVLVWW